MTLAASLSGEHTGIPTGNPRTTSRLNWERPHFDLCLTLIECLRFPERARKFPGLVNGCTINWFLAWPAEALVAVSRGFIGNAPIECSEEVRLSGSAVVGPLGCIYRFSYAECHPLNSSDVESKPYASVRTDCRYGFLSPLFHRRSRGNVTAVGTRTCYTESMMPRPREPFERKRSGAWDFRCPCCLKLYVVSSRMVLVGTTRKRWAKFT